MGASHSYEVLKNSLYKTPASDDGWGMVPDRGLGGNIVRTAGPARSALDPAMGDV